MGKGNRKNEIKGQHNIIKSIIQNDQKEIPQFERDLI